MLVPACGVWVFLDCGGALDGLESLDIGLGWGVSGGLLVAEAGIVNHSRVRIVLLNQKCDKRFG